MVAVMKLIKNRKSCKTIAILIIFIFSVMMFNGCDADDSDIVLSRWINRNFPEGYEITSDGKFKIYVLGYIEQYIFGEGTYTISDNIITVIFDDGGTLSYEIVEDILYPLSAAGERQTLFFEKVSEDDNRAWGDYTLNDKNDIFGKWQFGGSIIEFVNDRNYISYSTISDSVVKSEGTYMFLGNTITLLPATKISSSVNIGDGSVFFMEFNDGVFTSYYEFSDGRIEYFEASEELLSTIDLQKTTYLAFDNGVLYISSETGERTEFFYELIDKIVEINEKSRVNIMLDYIISYSLVGLLVGIGIGIIPAVCGGVKQKIRHGIVGFFACAVSGAILGLLLAVPCCAVFMFFIFKGSASSQVGANLISCRDCGKKVSPNAPFCLRCGNPISGGAVSHDTHNNVLAPMESLPLVKSKNKIIIITSAVAVLIVAVIVVSVQFYRASILKDHIIGQWEYQSSTTIGRNPIMGDTVSIITTGYNFRSDGTYRFVLVGGGVLGGSILDNVADTSDGTYFIFGNTVYFTADANSDMTVSNKRIRVLDTNTIRIGDDLYTRSR
jgi:hypothetical protein